MMLEQLDIHKQKKTQTFYTKDIKQLIQWINHKYRIYNYINLKENLGENFYFPGSAKYFFRYDPKNIIIKGQLTK